MAKYLIFILLTLLGFSSIAHILWGPFTTSYRTFGDSFLNMLLFSTGKLIKLIKYYLFPYLLGVYNADELIQYNPSWSIVFVIAVFVFIMFFMYAIFVSINSESLRRTVIQGGYPEDKEATSWKLKDFATWLCYCVKNDDDKQNTN